MENVENEIVKTEVSRSDLSDWSGAPVQMAHDQLDVVKHEDRVVPDHMDYGLRGYDLFNEGYSFDRLEYGPASAPLSIYNLTNLMKNSRTFQNMIQYFEGIAYDSVTYRITCSNPKGLVGGFVVGIYPHVQWNTSSFQDQRIYFDANLMCRQHLLLSPSAELVTYGEAKDVVITVPWQYNVPYLPRKYVQTFDDTLPAASGQSLWPGTPVLWFVNLGASYVSTLSYPAQIKVYVTFENLRFSGPSFLTPVPEPEALRMSKLSRVSPQSGVETLVPAALAALSSAASSVGSEILTDAISGSSPSDVDASNSGTYENPQAVQLAYVGDSTKFGPPPTTPIFRPWKESTEKHKIMDFLRQPQYLHTIDTTGEIYHYANPTAMRGAVDLSGNDQLLTYFRYFSQACSYWRGTLIFDFVIMGHPMVEVGYSFQILYPPFSDLTATSSFSQNSVLRGVCSGTYTVSVPMPYMIPIDHIQVIDNRASIEEIRANSSSIVLSIFRVVSTMLDAPPVIPVAVFVRAGEDFQFLQPYAVGLGYVQHPDEVDIEEIIPPPDFSESLARRRNKQKGREKVPSIDFVHVEPQVRLPPVTEVFQTRAKAQLSTSQMLSMTHVEDFMNIWSRALPYATYNGDNDPIVALSYGVSPSWYPPVSTEFSHILGSVNSWWVTNDYVSFYSSMYLYYKGSIGMKILCKPGTGYKYVTLLSSADASRLPGRNTFTYVSTQLPPEANLGYGTVATDLSGQPVLEITIPLRSSLEWGMVNGTFLDSILDGQYSGLVLTGSIRTNVVLHTESSDLEDALYRKSGKDYNLAVRTLLPPPVLWMAKGNNWS